MGLIPYILRSVVHLLFVAMDVLVLMVLVIVVYDRWHFTWLKPLFDLVEQPIKSVTNCIDSWLYKRTRKHYPERTLIILFLIGMTLVRLVICALVYVG